MIRAHSSSGKPPTPVPKAGSARDRAPAPSATRRQLSVVRRTRAASVRRSWPITAPWITHFADSRPAPVATASPTSIGPFATASRSISSPPARLIAPATPAPIQSASFAAFVIASTSSTVMSPSTTESSSSPTAEPPEALVHALLLAPLRERLAAVLLGGQVHLGGEAGRGHREGQRVDRDIPTLERAVVIQQVERLPVADVEHGETAVWLAREMVVEDDEAPTPIGDVLVQQLVRLPRRHAVGRHGVDHVAALLAALQLIQADGEPRREPGQVLQREQDAGQVGLAVEGVVPDREQLSVAPEQHLLVGDEPREPYRVDLGAAETFCRRLGGTRRRVLLRLAVELDDLGARQVAGGLGGEAHHQHRSDREVRGVEERDTLLLGEPRQSGRLPAGRPDDARDRSLERRSHVCLHGLRRSEVDDRLGTVELDQIVSGRLQRRRQHRTHLAAAPVEGDLHAAAVASAGLTRSTAARKRSSLGPIAAADSRSGASKTPASSARLSASTASISAMIRSSESISVSVISDLPSRLIRLEVASIERRIRPFRFSLARSSSFGRRLPEAMSPICSAAISRQGPRFSSRVPT